MNSPLEPNDCPITCPNRKRDDSRAGRIASSVFALAVAIFLGFSCRSYERRGEFVPVEVWMPCFLLIGAGLGVSIDSAKIGGLIKGNRD